MIYKLVQVKLPPSDHSTDKNKSKLVDYSIGKNTVLLCDRHCTKEWRDNFSSTSWERIMEETQMSMHMWVKISPLELAHLMMWLNIVSYLISMWIECCEVLHKRGSLNESIISFATGSTGGDNAVRMHLSVITWNKSIKVVWELATFHWCKDFLRLFLQVTRSLGASHGYDDIITSHHTKSFFRATS